MCQGHTAKTAVQPSFVSLESVLHWQEWFGSVSCLGIHLGSYEWNSHLWRAQNKPEPDREFPWPMTPIQLFFGLGGGLPESWFSDAKIPQSNPILLVSRELLYI